MYTTPLVAVTLLRFKFWGIKADLFLQPCYLEVKCLSKCLYNCTIKSCRRLINNRCLLPSKRWCWCIFWVITKRAQSMCQWIGSFYSFIKMCNLKLPPPSSSVYWTLTLQKTEVSKFIRNLGSQIFSLPVSLQCLVIGEITCSKMVVVLNKTDLLPVEKKKQVVEKVRN